MLAFNKRSHDSASTYVYIVFINTFMNFVNKYLAGRITRDKMGALEVIGASLLLASNLLGALTNSSYFMELVKKLTQGLHQVIQNPGAITIV